MRFDEKLVRMLCTAFWGLAFVFVVWIILTVLAILAWTGGCAHDMACFRPHFHAMLAFQIFVNMPICWWLSVCEADRLVGASNNRLSRGLCIFMAAGFSLCWILGAAIEVEVEGLPLWWTLAQTGMGFGAIIGLCNSIKILYQYASPHGRKKKVHMSFSGRCKAPLFGAVQDAVVKGGCEFTAIHTAQTEGWFEVWSAKARVADYVIVLFTAEYQSTFTPALKQEADLIHELHEKGTVVYIFDDVGAFGPKMAAAEIQTNLMEDVRMMGAFQRWWDFVCAEDCV